MSVRQQSQRCEAWIVPEGCVRLAVRRLLSDLDWRVLQSHILVSQMLVEEPEKAFLNFKVLEVSVQAIFDGNQHCVAASLLQFRGEQSCLVKGNVGVLGSVD